VRRARRRSRTIRHLCPPLDQSPRRCRAAVVSCTHPEVARAHLRRGPPVASKRATLVPHP